MQGYNRNTLENDYRKSISPSHISQPKPFIVKRWINVSTFKSYSCSHLDDFSSQKEDVLKTTCSQVTLRRKKLMDSHYLTPTEDSLYSEKTIERKYFWSVSVRNSSYSTRRPKRRYRFTDRVIYISFELLFETFFHYGIFLCTLISHRVTSHQWTRRACTQ
jgi:hypothetical protein